MLKNFLVVTSILKYNLKLFLIISGFVFMLEGNCQKYNICGFVFDSITNEPLIGASLYDNYYNGCITDKNGFFCLQINYYKNVELNITFIGYKKKDIKFISLNDTLINVFLSPGIGINEVEVKGYYKNRRELGTLNIPVKQLKNLPTITGEPDLLKAFQLMPGVQMGDEGSSGLYVRGGNPDQNLYLIDDVPLYYINHLGGFISVFDINTLKKATLYKGDFPARYGGRLSSVLDIRLKDGNSKEYNNEFMLGTLATKIFSEGPIIKDKTTYMISIRRCNIDLFMKPITLFNSGGNEKYAYTFNDINTKIVHNINQKNKLTGLLYVGRDKLLYIEKHNANLQGSSDYLSEDKIKWGNHVGSIKWNHLINNNIFLETRLGYTSFFYKVENNLNITSRDEHFESNDIFNSGIRDFTLQNDIKFIGKKYKLLAGFGGTLHEFNPSLKKYKIEESNYSESKSYINTTLENELITYFDSEWKLNKKISVFPGLFMMLWPNKDYLSLDPRLSIHYEITPDFLFKSSYSLTHQYVHLLTTNDSGIPSDLWVPSTSQLKPESAQQYSVGVIINYNGLEITFDSYFKILRNLIMYKPGTNIFYTTKWENSVETSGIGKVKGIELLIQKKYGKNTGWIAYSLSKNDRKFENINKGNYFPYKYDHRHEIKIFLNCSLSKNIAFSLTWLYTTGNAITLATKKYPAVDFDNYGEDYDEFTLYDAHYYNGINNYRTDSYHRLDIGFNFNKEKTNYQKTLYIGIYNIYNRKNPYYYFFKTKNKKTNLYKFSLFPIIPSISYSIKF